MRIIALEGNEKYLPLAKPLECRPLMRNAKHLRLNIEAIQTRLRAEVP